MMGMRVWELEGEGDDHLDPCHHHPDGDGEGE